MWCRCSARVCAPCVPVWLVLRVHLFVRSARFCVRARTYLCARRAFAFARALICALGALLPSRAHLFVRSASFGIWHALICALAPIFDLAPHLFARSAKIWVASVVIRALGQGLWLYGQVGSTTTTTVYFRCIYVRRYFPDDLLVELSSRFRYYRRPLPQRVLVAVQGPESVLRFWC